VKTRRGFTGKSGKTKYNSVLQQSEQRMTSDDKKQRVSNFIVQ
jgi:hypothetical protein